MICSKLQPWIIHLKVFEIELFGYKETFHLDRSYSIEINSIWVVSCGWGGEGAKSSWASLSISSEGNKSRPGARPCRPPNVFIIAERQARQADGNKSLRNRFGPTKVSSRIQVSIPLAHPPPHHDHLLPSRRIHHQKQTIRQPKNALISHFMHMK